MTNAKKVVLRVAGNGKFLEGRSVAMLGAGMTLVKVGRASKSAARPEERTDALVKKAASALSRPGIPKSAVFKGANADKIFSYSALPQDTTKVVRHAADGSISIGKLVDGRFRALKR